MAGTYRVLLTRADNAGLRALLDGVAVVAVPLIALRPSGVALPVPAAEDWVVYSSVPGVRFAGRLAESPARLAAVGPKTAAALAAAHRAPEVVPEHGHAEGLARALGEQVRGRTVWLPGPAGPRSGLREALAARGADPRELAVYENHLPRGAQADLAAAGPVDLVACASGSAVRHYLAAGGDPAVPVAAIGPSTAAVCRELGLTLAGVADPHTAEGLAVLIRDLSCRTSA